MSLLRALCVLLTTTCFHITYTSPNPTPPMAEREFLKSTVFEGLLRNKFKHRFRFAVLWLAALAEITVIIVHTTIDSTFGQYLQSMRFLDIDLDTLRLTTLSILGMFCIIAGTSLRWLCYKALGRLFTFEMSIRKGHTLVTTGPYSVVRHPAYTGTLLVTIGTFLWFGAPGSWVRESGILSTGLGTSVAASVACINIGALFGLLSRMSKEDEALQATFGQQWSDWAQRVQYTLIPGIY
ncbi:hypothetical protein AX17_002680 [Amanita inopinata Kibby_2008]|nr:hypothetical protein AX17_002680 [Amanita inopinata Kibby_2008]